MREVARFSGILLEKDMGHRRKELFVVDADTGEIMLRRHVGNLFNVFESGASVVVNEYMLSREVAENTGAEHFYLKDSETGYELFDWWRKPDKHKRVNDKPKHTGGKPSYIKIFSRNLEKLAQLKDAELGFLMRLVGYVDWRTGALVKGRPKRPLTTGDLPVEMNISVDTADRRVEALKGAGALMVGHEGCLIVSRDFFQKG